MAQAGWPGRFAGCVEHVGVCQRLGVRPIVGARLSYKSRRRTVLVAEPEGYRSLCRVITRQNLDQKADLTETLSIHHAGLQVLVDQPAALTPSLVDAFAGRLWVELAVPARRITSKSGEVQTRTAR